MTETRDFDRLARAWLDLMPDEAPDRVIDAVLQAVDVTPQRRTPFDPAIRRFFPMNRLTYAAVALAIVVLGGGALLLTQFRQTNVGPSQGPTATPGPSPTLDPGAPLPQALQAPWFGGGRTLAGLEAGAGTVLRLGPLTFKIAQANQQAATLFGGAAASVNGRIKVERGSGPALACGTDIGSYAYALSASGQTLTISDPQDSCAIRQSTLLGTWWRIDCRNGDDECLGEVDAGTYSSQYFRPILAGAPWTPRFGGLTFTVPDGWANDADYPGNFSLSLAPDFEKTSPSNSSPSTRLQVLADVAAESQATACSNQPQPGVAHTAKAIVAWLRTVRGLNVGASTPVTVGTLTGTSVDLSMNVAKAPMCGTDKLVEYLYVAANAPEAGYAIGSERQRLVLVDVAPNDVMAIVLYAPDDATLTTFAQAALPVIATFEFK